MAHGHRHHFHLTSARVVRRSGAPLLLMWILRSAGSGGLTTQASAAKARTEVSAAEAAAPAT